MTQETWIIVQGLVSVTYYDLAGDEVLCKRVLHQGDITITLAGGHTYTCIEEDSQVIEIKTGPYIGVNADKEFIS